MSNQVITNELESEISRLERQLAELEAMKKDLKSEIKSHQKALKLLSNSSGGARASEE